MDRVVISNIKGFLERTPVTGMECYAWVEAHYLLQQMLAEIDRAEKTPTQESPK